MKLWSKNTLILILVLLVGLDVLVWREIVFAKVFDKLEIYFFDVGQGDSELVVLPGKVKILIDGGPSNKILSYLPEIFPLFDRYVDLVINSHPHPDHFVGLIDVLKNYQVGEFLDNGCDGGIPAWEELEKTVAAEKVPELILAAGDKIFYQNNELDILAPDKNFIKQKDLNETSLVVLLKNSDAKALFVGDSGAAVEKYLAAKFQIQADILKVGHHGSKYSSTAEFLKAVAPKIAVIEVGKNTYGHPTPETLSHLANIGAMIFRTDLDGTVKLVADKKQIHIYQMSSSPFIFLN